MVSKKELENRWKVVEKLLASTHEKADRTGEDSRMAAYREETKDLADEDVFDFLDEVLEVLQEQEKRLKKRKVERLCRLVDSSDDDEASSSTAKAQPKGRDSKVLLEDKTSALKRTTAARYLEVCGGKAASYKGSKGFVEFLSCTSLPSGYDQRMTKLANESHVCMKAMSLLKTGKAVGASDLTCLGEIVLAETAAKAFVLYAAWHREVVENHRWSDANALQANIEQTVKTTLALALKDATGEDIKKPSLGDIFVEKDGQMKKDAQKPPQLSHKETPAWAKEKPKAFPNSNLQCRTCGGWSHKSSECRNTPGFGGYCSKCHGKGHKQPDCPSS